MVTTESEVLLYTIDKHTPESHSAKHAISSLKLPQKAAVQSAVRMHLMASPTNVCRNLHLVEKKQQDEVYISIGGTNRKEVGSLGILEVYV